MRRIHVDRLVERERDVARVERPVCAGVERRERCLGEARDELLDVADALGSGSWVAGSVAVPELNVFGQGR